MKMLDDYFKLQQDIYDYFGYVEDWVVIPLDDCTSYFWELGEDEVRYSEEVEKLEDWEAGQYYAAEIYRQRFLPKWVYRVEDYTMVCADTHVDGNKFLMVFDNAKEQARVVE